MTVEAIRRAFPPLADGVRAPGRPGGGRGLGTVPADAGRGAATVPAGAGRGAATVPAGAGWRPAAVLCPLFTQEGEAWLILTRRASTLRSHTGEVSLPGGRMEPGEAPVATALREAQEEIGLDPARVEILGTLSTMTTMRDPAPITPLVGLIAGGRPPLVANAAEVEHVITVPVAELYADDVHYEEVWEVQDQGARPFYFFELAGDTVWGATARVLRELLELVWAANEWAA